MKEWTDKRDKLLKDIQKQIKVKKNEGNEYLKQDRLYKLSLSRKMATLVMTGLTVNGKTVMIPPSSAKDYAEGMDDIPDIKAKSLGHKIMMDIIQETIYALKNELSITESEILAIRQGR